MIIILTSRKGRVYEVENNSNYSVVLDKLNWLINHLEGLGYMLVEESKYCYEFANRKGWRYGVMIANDYIKLKP
jgi:hypothetical protein